MRKCASMSILIFVLVVGVCLSITAHAQEAETPVIEWTVYVGGSNNDSIGGIHFAPGHVVKEGNYRLNIEMKLAFDVTQEQNFSIEFRVHYKTE